MEETGRGHLGGEGWQTLGGKRRQAGIHMKEAEEEEEGMVGAVWRMGGKRTAGGQVGNGDGQRRWQRRQRWWGVRALVELAGEATEVDLQKRQACRGSGHVEKVGWRRIRAGVETAPTVEATTAEAGVEETSGLWRGSCGRGNRQTDR